MIPTSLVLLSTAWLVITSCVILLAKRKRDSDEIHLLIQVRDEKQKELDHRNQIEILCSEIERLDEDLYAEEIEEPQKPLNDVFSDEKLLREGEAIRRGFGGLGVSTEDLDKHNEASVSVLGPMQYLEKATAYAGGVVVEASTTYPELKTIGGNEMKKEEMNEEGVEYFEQLALKDQALRTMEILIDTEPASKSAYESMIKNGVSENKAMLSAMEFMERMFKNERKK